MKLIRQPLDTMRFTLVIAALLLGLLSSVQAQAQTVPAPQSVGLQVTQDTTMHTQEVAMVITLPANTTLHGFHISLGLTAGGTELLDQYFDLEAFDVAGIQSLVRDGDQITLVIGNYLPGSVYASCYVQNGYGDQSTTVSTQHIQP